MVKVLKPVEKFDIAVLIDLRSRLVALILSYFSTLYITLELRLVVKIFLKHRVSKTYLLAVSSSDIFISI